jgi:exosortase
MWAERRWAGASLVSVQLLGLWPVWRWYWQRVTDGSDEPWGLLALGSALLCACRDRGGSEGPDRTGLRVSLVFMMAYLLALGAAPALLRAVLGVSALAFTLAALGGARAPRLSLWGLLLLSLPLLSSLQFYLGYPLRLATAFAATGVLRMLGLAVEQQGTTMTWFDQTVLIDGPCSGIQMLWVGLFLCALFAELLRTPAKRFLMQAMASLGIVLAGNTLRATLLFFKETRLVELPDWTHEGVGLLTFAVIAGLILRLMGRRAYAHP